MEELLNLDFFVKYLNPVHIKAIVFVWNIFKCTLLFVIALKLISFFAKKIVNNIVKKVTVETRKQQLITFCAIIIHALKAVVFAVYVVSLLNIFGIDIRPILATAGVMGVAIGFGAKRFVEDVISGIIILLEGQVRVGDYVQIGAIEGVVEKITLPLITVRSTSSGALCYIRCGYIDSIINHTMEYAYVTYDFDVAYKENINHVLETLRKSFDILNKDIECSSKIIGNIDIFGLDAFKESPVCIKCRIKTQPNGQWFIKRKFNKIVKEQFELEGIEIPFNQLVVTKNN